MKGLCPYCGSNDVKLYADITISCNVNPNGKITVNECWSDAKKLYNEVLSTSNDRLAGYCYNCKKYLIAERDCDNAHIKFKF